MKVYSRMEGSRGMCINEVYHSLMRKLSLMSKLMSSFLVFRRSKSSKIAR